MLPDFFIVGTQKGGTTSLKHYLELHPEVYIHSQKECKFFVRNDLYTNGLPFLEKYFDSWKNQKVIGLVDPDIMFFEESIERMKKYIDFSTTKFIFILRDPVERAFSHYLMTYRRGLEPLSFEEAIEKEEERLSKGGFFEKMHYSYVSRGFYLKQIKRFLPYVRKSQMLFLLTEELKKDPVNILKKIFEFLNVSSDFVPPNINIRYHKATVPRSVTLLRMMKSKNKIKKAVIRFLIPSSRIRRSIYEFIDKLNQTERINIILKENTRRKLAKIYENENKNLSEFLGIDLSLYWDSMKVI